MHAASTEEPFLYTAVFMANASSLYLPGSNLTNLLVLAREPLPGGAFATRLLAPAVAATVMTAAGLWLLFRRQLRGPRRAAIAATATHGTAGVGLLAALTAAALTRALAHPAVPVISVGILAVTIQIRRDKLDVAQVIAALGPAVLTVLFAGSVALGALARA